VATRVLITGGAGFLGCALARRLSRECQVVLLDNLLRNALTHTDLLEQGRVNLVRGDVLDPKAVTQALEGCRLIIHLASVAGVDAVEADPVGTMRTALLGADNLLKACRKQSAIDRVVLLSSSEVYGPDAREVTESSVDLPCGIEGARWSYALGKLAAEQLGLGYQRQYGLPVCVARPFNVYGPGQVGQGAVHTLVERALAGLPLQLHNGGDQVRAWCYVEDLVDGLEKMLSRPEAIGQVFNLGNPDCSVTVRQLAEKVASLTGQTQPPVSVPRSGAEVSYRVPDISKARRMLDFSPLVDLDEGLRRTISWYRSLTVS
jgi:nucleoside-diphosphate-sugar epimerase